MLVLMPVEELITGRSAAEIEADPRHCSLVGMVGDGELVVVSLTKAFRDALATSETSSLRDVAISWAGTYDLGPGRRDAVPGLRVIVASPGPRGSCWTYVTAGCWSTAEKHGHGLEFALTAPAGDESFVDLLAKIAYYHAGHHLDLEHSMPIGEPWIPGSSCDHLLASLSYLHGPDLEHCPLPNGRARILWTLPVTAAEVAFRREHGHEALEQLFDEHEIDPTDPKRASVV
ncbi:suppressor of fused domain protein [Kitasatospora sp. NBC_01287]|uniref:suppressor of fused domain protein n=1 Tax=Kitasatospora sp. NBC_01287 TaxID=2903573 RepID=UPI002251B4AD|nr:suppressor of fused domain protein [Kitasatospora sp. NBC_01287]MCX4750544.1 suppressor of fused domain protein [Kitasatospora sp. NBC_01287]